MVLLLSSSMFDHLLGDLEDLDLKLRDEEFKLRDDEPVLNRSVSSVIWSQMLIRSLRAAGRDVSGRY